MRNDIADVLSKKTAQLSAMLTVIYGGGYEAFQECEDKIKDNYLWACADLAKEIKDLTEQLPLMKLEVIE